MAYRVSTRRILTEDQILLGTIVLSPILMPLVAFGIVTILFSLFIGFPLWAPLISFRDGDVSLQVLLCYYAAMALSFFTLWKLEANGRELAMVTLKIGIPFWLVVTLIARLVYGRTEEGPLMMLYLDLQHWILT